MYVDKMIPTFFPEEYMRGRLGYEMSSETKERQERQHSKEKRISEL
jgi:hypothetical protein